MRRLWLLFAGLLVACRAFSAAPVYSPTASPTLTATPSVVIPTLFDRMAITPLPDLATPQATSTLPPLSTDGFQVVLHPDGPLYVGDLVSIEVISPEGIDLQGRTVQFEAQASLGRRSAQSEFGLYGIAGRPQATMLWVWDTAGLAVGEHILSFSLPPDGPVWTETVSLAPREDLPPPEPQAAWARGESDCCLVYYITGSQAARDLPELLDRIDAQFQRAQERLPADLDEPLEVTLLSRVIGHGGFARADIAVSYLDRNYAGANFESVLHHEIVHALDGRLGGGLRPIILIEGLAVYLTGGHFKPEPLMPRAAALLPPEPGCELAPPGEAACGLDWYVPLVPLIDNFYLEQHEIGYLQAGALVSFLVDTWGWEAFSEFYRHIHSAATPSANGDIEPSGRLPGEAPLAGGDQAQAIDVALREHFDLTLEELEARFLEALRQEPLSPQWVADVRLTVEYYETVRRYQRALDPSAYFLSAWLPDSAQMRERGIVADFLRRPSSPENIEIELLLVSADQALRQGDYDGAAYLLARVNAVLDELYPDAHFQ